MLIVETIAKIRRLHFTEGKGIKTICRDLKLSKKVVRKVIRTGITAFTYTRTVQPRPKLGAWLEELSRLLAINAARGRRERLTLIQIYEELCVFRGIGAAISRDRGHAFHAIAGSRFAVAGRLVDRFMGSGLRVEVKGFRGSAPHAFTR